MTGLSPMALAVVWSVAMVLSCAVATVIVLRTVPPVAGPRLFALLGVDAIALVFLGVAVMACFVWPEPFGLSPADLGPFIVVMVAYALLVLGLVPVIFLLPVKRARVAGAGVQPPTTIVRR